MHELRAPLTAIQGNLEPLRRHKGMPESEREEARHFSQGQTLSLSAFEPARTEGNEDRLKQPLLILLDNALKYTPADGQITMSLQRQAVDAVVMV